jgi:hypothetical protein
MAENIVQIQINILGVWWIARDPAKVEDQVRFLVRIFGRQRINDQES